MDQTFESTVLTELPETDETLSAFDEGWDEEFSDFAGDGHKESEEKPTDAGEAEQNSEGTEANADQQEADRPDGEGTGEGESSESKAEGDEGNPDQGETFTLRHFGEERTVDREEVIKLAQQGWDYPRIKEKWDAVKDDVPKLRMYEGFLQELADARGGDIESLIDETRTRSLLAQANARGEKLDASAAAAQAVQARIKAMAPAEAQKQADTEEAAAMRKQAAVDRFRKLYGEVPATDIPKEVWDEAEELEDLVIPYQRWQNRKLEEDNKRLQKELEQAKQQQKNKESSMGSSKSTGQASAKDPMDDGWAEGWNS